MKDIKWAVLGTGVIANEMAVALKKNGRNIYAVGNRTYDKAVAFAEKYGIGKVYSDYNEMFTDPEVDVIYITTPHNTHIQFMRRAIENGKHILVEKSITLNSYELEEMLELAEQHNVIIGEAMTIYHMPIYRKLKELLDSGALGKVNLITMNFGSFKDYDMNNRFFNRNLSGGAMLDIGVYALSFIRWFMDSKPDKLLSQVNTIWQCDGCRCIVWVENHKNAVGCFAIHAAVDPECKHIFVETVHGSDVCVDIVCIGKTKRCMGFAEGDQSLVIVINILISLIF